MLVIHDAYNWAYLWPAGVNYFVLNVHWLCVPMVYPPSQNSSHLAIAAGVHRSVLLVMSCCASNAALVKMISLLSPIAAEFVDPSISVLALHVDWLETFDKSPE